MSASTLNAQTRGFGLSVAITCVISALLVVVKETNDGLMKFMKTITVHHWVTHGIFDVLVFLVIGYLLAKSNDGKGPDIDDGKLLQAIVAGFLLGIAIVAAFYLLIG
jgi:nitric oxide reductase large subunit